MTKIKNIAIIVSVLCIGNYNIATDSQGFEADLQRYYGGPYSPHSYIDTNKNFVIDTGAYKNTYPNNYPGGPSGVYNPANSPYQKYFQPSDGSLTNGTYDVQKKTATTPLHSYKDIIIMDGTYKTPALNENGKFIDQQGNELQPVGSFMQRSQDESDTFMYYLFGKIADPKDSDTLAKKAANKATQTFDSQGE